MGVAIKTAMALPLVVLLWLGPMVNLMLGGVGDGTRAQGTIGDRVVHPDHVIVGPGVAAHDVLGRADGVVGAAVARL